MANYIYRGPLDGPGVLPDGTIVTLKLPMSTGGFSVIKNVQVRVTLIPVTDTKAVQFVESRVDMCGNKLYVKQ